MARTNLLPNDNQIKYEAIITKTTEKKEETEEKRTNSSEKLS
jgi:hypothetical protein